MQEKVAPFGVGVVAWMFPAVKELLHQSLGSALNFMFLWGDNQIREGNETNLL